MNSLENYLEAAERENTRRSYASALRHFEVEWNGLLPATPEMVARYLADFASTLSVNTLKHRLAALSRWHTTHGFPDPTKALVVRQTLKGIRTLHPALERKARPLQLDVLQQVDTWLEHGIAEAKRENDHGSLLRHSRDRALILLGFWRGFRSDELVRLQVEHIAVTQGEGLSCYLPRSKSDRFAEGRTVLCPALSRLCPVSAYEAWIAVSGLTSGAVFRRIDRWGHLATNGLTASTIIPMLRRLLSAAGVAKAEEYSSHSLRRGFAGWANTNGWDLKDLMEYVGWRDIHSALRYLDTSPERLKDRFEQGLAVSSPTPAKADSPVPRVPQLRLIEFPKK